MLNAKKPALILFSVLSLLLANVGRTEAAPKPKVKAEGCDVSERGSSLHIFCKPKRGESYAAELECPEGHNAYIENFSYGGKAGGGNCPGEYNEKNCKNPNENCLKRINDDVSKNGKLVMSNKVFGDPAPHCAKGFEATASCQKKN
jgi:hypothetical protein